MLQTYSVKLTLCEFFNVELDERGYYQVRAFPQPSSSFVTTEITLDNNSDSVVEHSVRDELMTSTVLKGVGISKTVEVTYIEEKMALEDTFNIHVKLNSNKAGNINHLNVCFELWHMERHRPPRTEYFSKIAELCVQVPLDSMHLHTASRPVYFGPSYTWAGVSITVYSCLVDISTKTKSSSNDNKLKLSKLHTGSAYSLLSTISSIESFITQHSSLTQACVKVDQLDVQNEMRLATEKLDCSDNFHTDFENYLTIWNSRVALMFQQLIWLFRDSIGVRSILLLSYYEQRKSILHEGFFVAEKDKKEISNSSFSNYAEIFEVVTRGKYLNLLPKLPLFCGDADSPGEKCPVIFEERYTTKNQSLENRTDSGSESNTLSPTVSNSEITSQSETISSRENTPKTSKISEDPREAISTSHFISSREELRKKLKEAKYNGDFYRPEYLDHYNSRCAPSTSCSFNSKVDKKNGKETHTHLVVFVHGLEGSHDDLIPYRQWLRVAASDYLNSEGVSTEFNWNFEYLMSRANLDETWTDIRALSHNLLSEVREFVEEFSDSIQRISFIAHSLGGVIVRSAVGMADDAEMPWLKERLYTLLTINCPHLGLAYLSKHVQWGVQIMKWWKKSHSMEQLSFRDALNFTESFMFGLSNNGSFGQFRNVLLIGTAHDRIVPCNSALLQPSKQSIKDLSAFGTAYRSMLSNVLSSISQSEKTENFVRFVTFHQYPFTQSHKLIGRAAHIAAVEDAVFIEKLLTVSAVKYFL